MPRAMYLVLHWRNQPITDSEDRKNWNFWANAIRSDYGDQEQGELFLLGMNLHLMGGEMSREWTEDLKIDPQPDFQTMQLFCYMVKAGLCWCNKKFIMLCWGLTQVDWMKGKCFLLPHTILRPLGLRDSKTELNLTIHCCYQT